LQLPETYNTSFPIEQKQVKNTGMLKTVTPVV